MKARSRKAQCNLLDSGPKRLLRWHCSIKGLATRKPMLLFSFAGLLLFRVDDDKLLELLFQ
ncbi:MAG: hypothetical protein DWI22_12860, partial [Planctomycetota bacterium]